MEADDGIGSVFGTGAFGEIASLVPIWGGEEAKMRNRPSSGRNSCKNIGEGTCLEISIAAGMGVNGASRRRACAWLGSNRLLGMM